MNDEERRRITEDGRWPLLKTRPDSLAGSDVNRADGGSASRADSKSGVRPGSGNRRASDHRDGGAAGARGMSNTDSGRNYRQNAVRRTGAGSGKNTGDRAGGNTGRDRRSSGRNTSAARRDQSASRRRRGNESSVGEYVRSIPRRIRRMFHDPSADIPFLIGFIIVIVLIVLIISLIVNAAVKGRSSRTTEQSVTAASVTPTPTPEPYTPTDIKLSFAGDVLMGMDENTSYSSSFNAFYDLNGADYFLQNVKQVFQNDDLSIVNLDDPLTESAERADKTYAYKGSADYTAVLTDGSIEAVNLANADIRDYGDTGYTDTVSALQSAGISHFGDTDVAVQEIRGVTVGFYGIDQTDTSADATARMNSAVQNLKSQNANVIVGYFYWGADQDTYPTQDMVNLAHSAVDAGTDIVVGCGAHQLEGIEYYNDRVIDYGLGSFCYGADTNPTDVRTIIFQPTVSINSQGQVAGITLNIVPCQMCSDVNYNDYQPKLLTGTDGQAVLDLLDERSQMITQNYASITTVYNSQTDGTTGADGTGISDESVSSSSVSADDASGTTDGVTDTAGTDTTGTTDGVTDTAGTDTTGTETGETGTVD